MKKCFLLCGLVLCRLSQMLFVVTAEVGTSVDTLSGVFNTPLIETVEFMEFNTQTAV